LREAVLDAYLGGKLEKELDAIHREFGQPETAATIRFVRKWAEKHGAFVRRHTQAAKPPSAVAAVEFISSNSNQLTLILTEDCNLRCRYCVYSGTYKYRRVHSPRRMPPELATHAIDWFIDLISPQLRRDPRKQVYLSFYGGEPLLNLPALRAALKHAQERYPGLLSITMTTNGTHLTEEIVKMLVEHQVHIGLSLDGPQSEHDRERVDRSGRGTHARILKNLKSIRENYPLYWREHLQAFSVYSYKSDLEAVATYFEQNEGIIPRCGRSFLVERGNSTYWQEATDDDYSRLSRSLRRLRDEYKEKLVNNARLRNFTETVAGEPIRAIIFRSRLDDPVLPFLPFGTTCFPGYKIAVEVDGTLNMCERVDGSMPIGHLGTETEQGIDGQRVRNIIDQYQRKVFPACASCCVSRFCTFCYAHALLGGVINPPSGDCATTAVGVKVSLREYVSIMELNPNADLPFSSKEVRL
jgi:uncharacterized protein